MARHQQSAKSVTLAFFAGVAMVLAAIMSALTSKHFFYLSTIGLGSAGIIWLIVAFKWRSQIERQP